MNLTNIPMQSNTNLPARQQQIHVLAVCDFFPQGEIQVVLRFSKEAANAVVETPISKDQETIRQNDGSVPIRASVVLSDRLHWWIRAFGPHAEVIAPLELRAVRC